MMRIRKIKDKDTSAAIQLLGRFGVRITDDEFSQRLHHFQYKRNHTVVVVEKRGRLVSLMHIGIEPSLVRDRFARVFALYVDPDITGSGMLHSMLKYGENWARQHGCLLFYDGTSGSRSVGHGS